MSSAAIKTIDAEMPPSRLGFIRRTLSDRALMAAMLLAAAVLIPRGILIVRAQSPTIDENYHIYRGLLFLRHDKEMLDSIRIDDPPLGEAIVALPAWWNHQYLSDPMHAEAYAISHPPPERLVYVMNDSVRIQTAIFKSILFLPGIGVIFFWLREIYSLGAAWLGVAMILVEPTFAAHIPLPTPDSMAAESILIAAFACWQFVQSPGVRQQILAAMAIAAALLIKHSALYLLPALLVLAIVHWRHNRAIGWANGFSALGWLAIWTFVCIWIFILCDVSVPRDFSAAKLFAHDSTFSGGIPSGLYFESVWEAYTHARSGHQNFLFGHFSKSGWWYYYPVLATFKIPIGLWCILALGAFSLFKVRPSYREIPLLICALVWLACFCNLKVDIGFRLFLPAEIFIMMLACRVATAGNLWKLGAWVAIAAACVDVALWTPDYLSYVNFPRKEVYFDISDSNIDWGQATRELRTYIQNHPDDHREITFLSFGAADQNLFDQLGPRLKRYLGPGRFWITRPEDATERMGGLPRGGLLIASPICITGQYDPHGYFTSLHNMKPIGQIGHALLIYDLDTPRDTLPPR